LHCCLTHPSHVLIPCSYEAGDHVGIFAPNSNALVEEAARLLQVDLDRIVSVIPVAGGRPVIGPCTVRRALAHFVELSSIPRKTFMMGALQYMSNDDDRQRLEQLLGDDVCSNAKYCVLAQVTG
jgi:NADPH-ferrihemoprotein reductase